MDKHTIYFAIGVICVTVIIVLYLLSWKHPESAHQTNISRRELAVWIAILFGSILLYRGVTNIMDDYFFPKHSLLSALACIILGVVIVGAAIYSAPEDVLAPGVH